jgi:hypothetical protein
MLKQLLTFAWHDSRLIDMVVDRSIPGKVDTVRFTVEWSSWEPHPPERRSIIEFVNCYRLEAEMNFGVICSEQLSDAWQEADHPQIALNQAFHRKNDLFCWVFETASTGSTIKIIARDVIVRPVPPLC